jgi:hypothetical protein
MSPKKQSFRDAKNFNIAMRVGCPIALAKRANCSSCSVFFLFIAEIQIKIQTYNIFLNKQKSLILNLLCLSFAEQQKIKKVKTYHKIFLLYKTVFSLRLI